jgi:hypothetical protein
LDWVCNPGFYKYDGRKLWLNDQPVSGHGHLFYGTWINHVLLASRGYEYDGFLFS